MNGPELVTQAHALGVDLLSADGGLVPQILGIDAEGQVVARTMLLGAVTAPEAAARALEDPEVQGLVYLGLADRGEERALFLEAATRREPLRHYQLFQAFGYGPEGLSLGTPEAYRVSCEESHLGPVFA